MRYLKIFNSLNKFLYLIINSEICRTRGRQGEHKIQLQYFGCEKCETGLTYKTSCSLMHNIKRIVTNFGPRKVKWIELIHHSYRS
jgi:hypothetical protein